MGTPDLVVEVVSTSSERKDLVRLRDAYARAGVDEYWIIDARGPQLHFEILKLVTDGYAPASPDSVSQVSEVLGRSFLFERQLNRLGRYRYRLIAYSDAFDHPFRADAISVPLIRSGSERSDASGMVRLRKRGSGGGLRVGLGFEALLASHRCAAQRDDVRVVHEAIADGVSNRRITESIVPSFRR